MKGIIEKPWKHNKEIKQAFTVGGTLDLNRDSKAKVDIFYHIDTQFWTVIFCHPNQCINLSPTAHFVSKQVLFAGKSGKNKRYMRGISEVV